MKLRGRRLFCWDVAHYLQISRPDAWRAYGRPLWSYAPLDLKDRYNNEARRRRKMPRTPRRHRSLRPSVLAGLRRLLRPRSAEDAFCWDAAAATGWSPRRCRDFARAHWHRLPDQIKDRYGAAARLRWRANLMRCADPVVMDALVACMVALEIKF